MANHSHIFINQTSFLDGRIAAGPTTHNNIQLCLGTHLTIDLPPDCVVDLIQELKRALKKQQLIAG